MMARDILRSFTFGMVCCALSACGSGGNPNAAPDLAAQSPDLGQPADLNSPPDLAPAFSSDGGMMLACTPQSTGIVTKKLVMNELLMPPDSHTYAYDLVGRQPPRPTNALGDLVAAMASANLNVQDEATKEVNAGQLVQLFTTTSTDSTFTTDVCAATLLNTGKPTSAPPDFSQVQTFVVDTSVAAGAFSGPLANQRFSSGDTATTVPPVLVHFPVPMIPGGGAPLVPIQGAHIRWSFSPTGLVNGQLNGAIKKSDVDKIIIPSIATALTGKIAADKANGGLNATDQQILAIFDVGGCTNPDGSMAMANDFKIDICEVANNALIQTVLKPDVALFDANGNWSPNPHATVAQHDSLSVGFGFTAVPAQF